MMKQTATYDFNSTDFIFYFIMFLFHNTKQAIISEHQNDLPSAKQIMRC